MEGLNPTSRVAETGSGCLKYIMSYYAIIAFVIVGE